MGLDMTHMLKICPQGSRPHASHVSMHMHMCTHAHENTSIPAHVHTHKPVGSCHHLEMASTKAVLKKYRLSTLSFRADHVLEQEAQ